MIKEFTMVFSIIIIHELGHLIAAKHFNWKLDKIAIYPFGGCVKLEENLSKPLKEELIILLLGPLMQIIFFFLVYFFFDQGLMTYRNYIIFKSYHYTLLIFNLLPIYPLDGGRIFNVFLNNFLPFKKGNKLVIVLSLILIFLALYHYRSLNFTLMGIMLFVELLLYLKRQNYLYNKMLLERYLYKKSFNKLKVAKNKDSMYQNKRHIIFYKNKYITEKDYLNRRFKVMK